MLKEKLIEFEKLLQSINAPVLKRLYKGIDVTEISADIPILPADVKTLFSWKNGTEKDNETELGQLWLFNFGYLLSLDEANRYYKQGANILPNWNNSKFPLFETGGGEIYLIECNEDLDGFGQIYFYSIQEFEHDYLVPIFDSLSTFIDTLIDCYLKKIYFFDEVGKLSFDTSKEAFIAQKFNPKSAYWRR